MVATDGAGLLRLPEDSAGRVISWSREGVGPVLLWERLSTLEGVSLVD